MMINQSGFVRRFGRVASRAMNFVTEWPVFLAIPLMAANVIVGVTARYVFNRPLPYVDEYAGYLMVIVVVFPLSWVLRRAHHIRIDLLVRVLPGRVANVLDLATMTVGLVIIVLLTVATGQLAMASFASGARAWSLMQTPLGPVQLILPVGLGLFAIQIMVEIVRRIKALGNTDKEITGNQK